jgi:predicted dehydrogenase
MQDIINVAFIGSGKISLKHASAISKLREYAELVAICDPSTDSLEAIKSISLAKNYSDPEEMLKSHPEIDLVFVLTPSGMHFEHCKLALKYKKHVLCEKPLTLNEAKARELIDSFSRENKHLFVMRQNRSNPAIIKLKKALDEGRLGKLCIINFRMRWCREQHYFQEKPWRGTKDMDGGILMNQANHFVDLLFWLFGRVESLAAFSDSYLVDVETEDSLVASMRFLNGAIGTIEATIATRPKDLEGSISILGEKGSVVIGGFSANHVQTWSLESSHGDTELHQIKALESEDSDKFDNAHERFLKRIFKEFENPTPMLLAGAEDIESLKFIKAIHDSIQKGSELSIRL